MRTDLEGRWATIQEWVYMQKTALGETVRRTFEENTAQIEGTRYQPIPLAEYSTNQP